MGCERKGRGMKGEESVCERGTGREGIKWLWREVFPNMCMCLHVHVSVHV